MASVKVPLIASAGITYQVGGGTNRWAQYGAYIKNGIVVKKDDGQFRIQKRDALFEYGQASVDLAYAIYNWQDDGVSKSYWLSITSSTRTIWSDYDSPSSIGTIAFTPYGKVTFCQTADPYLVMNPAPYTSQTDPLYYIDSSDTVTRLTNATNGTPSSGLTSGIAELDGFVFVATVDGKIYNSNVSDVTTWTSTDFISANRAQDATQFLCKHNNNIAVLGTRSIEFFYNAGNPGGSPLSRREDIFYNLGVYSDGNPYTSKYAVSNDSIIAFVGARKREAAESGAVAPTMGVYMIQNFQLKKITDDNLDAYDFTGHNINIMESGGRTYIILSIGNDFSKVYDVEHGIWYLWGTNEGDNGGYFNLVSAHTNLMIDAYGSIFEMRYARAADGNASSEPNTDFEVVTPEADFGIYGDKFIRSVSVIGEAYNGSGKSLSVSWSDDGGSTYNTARSLDAENWRPLYRCGTTKHRRFKLSHSGIGSFVIDGLMVDVAGGSNSRKDG